MAVHPQLHHLCKQEERPKLRAATDAMAASRRCRRAMLVTLCVARVSGAFPAGHATCCSEEKKCCGQTFPPPKSHACAEGHRCCVGDCDAVSLETVVARPARVRFRAPAPAPARPRRSRRRCRARATPTASGSRSARPRPRNRRRSPPAKPPRLQWPQLQSPWARKPGIETPPAAPALAVVAVALSDASMASCLFFTPLAASPS